MWGGLIPSSRQTENCSIHEWPEQDLTSSLSINAHMHTIRRTHQYSDWFTQTHTSRKTSVRPASYEFSSLFRFHPPVSSLSHLSCSLLPLPFSLLFLFLPGCFSHRLSIAPFFFCRSFKPRAFLSLFRSHISPLFARSVSSRRLAVFIFQSFISTNVRQCFCPPSIDPAREKEMGRRRQGAGKGKERCVGRCERKEWSSNKVRNGRESRIKQEEIRIFKSLSLRLTPDRLILYSPLHPSLHHYPSSSSCHPIVQISPKQLKYRYWDKKNNCRWTDQ